MDDSSFSEEELNRFLQPEVDPATIKAQEMCAAIWRFFGGAPNEQLGDARTIGFTITAEMVDTNGNRWIRHAAATGDGKVLPPWQVKGYLHDALDFANALYVEIAHRQEDETD